MGEKAAKVLDMSIRVCLPALLLLESDDGRVVNIYPSGRILLQKFPDVGSAEKTAEILAKSLLHS
ncbi:MAG: hypothetical protein JSW61_09630 [Candidatus Thorarchaeota archaeon]|nr:MAG: hypothetical protein JSW61_09630 [Candidatus Thorarchaeota archaeon]